MDWDRYQLGWVGRGIPQVTKYVALLFTLNLLDYVSTVFALQNGVGHEANPLISDIFSVNALVLKFVIAPIMLYWAVLVVYVQFGSPRKIGWMVAGGFLGYAVISNTFLAIFHYPIAMTEAMISLAVYLSGQMLVWAGPTTQNWILLTMQAAITLVILIILRAFTGQQTLWEYLREKIVISMIVTYCVLLHLSDLILFRPRHFTAETTRNCTPFPETPDTLAAKIQALVALTILPYYLVAYNNTLFIISLITGRGT